MRFRLLLLAVSIVAPFGCQKGPSFVGTWEGAHPAANGMAEAKSRITFSADGTYKDVTTGMSLSGSGLTANDTGTWQYKDGSIKLSLSDVEWTFTGRPDRVARARQRFLEEKAQIIQSHNAEPPAKVDWKGENEFAITYAGTTTTYRRVQ